MIQYSETVVNEFAPQLWDFTSIKCPSVGIVLPPVHSLMWNIANRRVLLGQFNDAQNTLVRQYARRCIYAAKSYGSMRKSLRLYFKDFKRDQPKLSHYFNALADAESCILHLHIMIDALNGLGSKSLLDDHFPQYKTANDFSNNIKHLAGQLKGGAYNKNRFLPVYFVDAGISNGKTVLAFSEMQKLIRGNGKVVMSIYRHSA